MFVTEEDVQKAQTAAEEAAEEAQRLAENAPPEHDVKWERAFAAARATEARSRALAAARQAQRAAIDKALTERAAAVKKMEPKLKNDEIALRQSIDQVNAAAADHIRALANLKQATDSHNHLVAEAAARLSAAGLQATQDGLCAPGDHHASGSNGRAGVYVRTVLYAPIDGTAVAMRAIGAVLGRISGGGHARRLYEIGRDWRAEWRLTDRADGFQLPPVPTPDTERTMS